MSPKVSEISHIDDLIFIRDLIKFDISQWVENTKEGELTDRDEVIEILEELTIVNDCISSLQTRIKQCQE